MLSGLAMTDRAAAERSITWCNKNQHPHKVNIDHVRVENSNASQARTLSLNSAAVLSRKVWAAHFAH